MTGLLKNKKKESSKDIKFSLWTLLLRTRQVMWKARQRELHQYGISTRSSGVILTILRLGEKATPSLISRELFLEPHTMSEHLKRMEKDGLIRRFKDSKRKNVVRLELTEKGYEAHRESSRRESLYEILSVLTDEEQLELWHILAKLREKAMDYIGMESKGKELYPPADPEELD